MSDRISQTPRPSGRHAYPLGGVNHESCKHARSGSDSCALELATLNGAVCRSMRPSRNVPRIWSDQERLPVGNGQAAAGLSAVFTVAAGAVVAAAAVAFAVVGASSSTASEALRARSFGEFIRID